MGSRTKDGLLVALGTVAVLAGVAFGAARADEVLGESRTKRTTGDDVMAAQLEMQEGLPEGARINADGLLVGVRIQAEPGTRFVPWEQLRAYDYERGLTGLPESIEALDGERVVMLGFLWAIRDYDDIRLFGLTGNTWACCFGIPPGLSDVVLVTLDERESGLSQTQNPIRVVGTFRVEEVQESGFTTAIFHIDDAVVTVLDY